LPNFYADEDCPPEPAHALVGRGYKVLTASDVGLANRKISDEEQLNYAYNNR